MSNAFQWINKYNTTMSLKRSENYLYFQNKAQHYYNVQTARPRVQSHLPSSLRKTIDHSQHLTNRDLPYNKQYEIDFQNKNLAKRILSISTKGRNEVEATGPYSRFHRFERVFRRKNPYKEEEQRQISLQNDKIKRHIDATKPRVGNNGDWEAEYKDKHNYRRLRSRYEEGTKSKGDLQIEKEPFLPDPYLKYIERLSPSSSQRNTERATSSRPKHVRLQKEKLFILPTFTPNAELFPQRKSANTGTPSQELATSPPAKQSLEK